MFRSSRWWRPGGRCAVRRRPQPQMPGGNSHSAPGLVRGGAEVRDRAGRLRSPGQSPASALPTRRSCRGRRIALAALEPLIEGFGGMMGVTLGTSAIVLFGAPGRWRTMRSRRAGRRSPCAPPSLGTAPGTAGANLTCPRAWMPERFWCGQGAAGIETIGPAIQTAAQLVHLLPAGMLAVTPDVFDRTKGYFRYGESQVFDLKNAGGPVALRELQGTTPARYPLGRDGGARLRRLHRPVGRTGDPG